MKHSHRFHFLRALALAVVALVMFGGLCLLASQAPMPTALASSLSLDSLVRADGTLNMMTGASGGVDLRGWQVNLDPKRGPVFSRTNGAPKAGEAWAGLGPGLNNDVNIVAFHGSDVYVGGAFTGLCNDLVCGNPTNMNNIARWDGSAWHSLGFGVSDDVYGLYVDGNDLYVSGYFTQLCGNAACNGSNTTMNHIARWDGSTWHALGNGLSRNPYVIVKHGTDFYVGGYFAEFCGNPACNSNTVVNHIARWDGTNWHAVGHGVSLGSASPAVTALAFNGNDLYVGGGFTAICGDDPCATNNVTVSNAARWDGSAWHPLGLGVDNTIYTFGMIGSDLYAGGDFGKICASLDCTSNIHANYIARWDGSQWNTVGNGLDGSVFDMTVNGNDLYVGGGFTHLCGNSNCSSNPTQLNHIARWDGSWHALTNGVDGNVYTIRKNGNDLYIGGGFINACGNADCSSTSAIVNRIAKLTFNPTQTGPTFVVNTDADTDDGLCDVAGQGFGNKDCTLREAINATNAHSGFDVIHFASGYTIYLSSALPTITDSLTIDGETNKVTLDGSAQYRILSYSSNGGGYLDHLSFYNARAEPSIFTYGESGGAIYSASTTGLDIRNSTFDNNSANAYGGAILSEGAIFVHNSTFIYNVAGQGGGGVSAVNGTYVNSTFTDNFASFGTAVQDDQTVTLQNTILGNSTGGVCAVNGVSANSKNNLIKAADGGGCGLTDGSNGNKVGVDPKLDALADNGGATFTAALLAGSPAIDAGDNTLCAADPINNLDQRGSTRPTDGDGNITATCDIGAFEAAALTNCTAGPAQPTLLKPANHKTMSKAKVAFDWTDAVCTTTGYKITVKNTTTHMKVTKTVTASNAKLPLGPGSYKWFVQACNANGCTKSVTFKFTN